MSAKFAVSAFVVEATTLSAPASAFAVKTGAVATPLPSVVTLTLVKPPGKVPEAPEAGAVKVTPAPAMPTLPPSFTVAASCVANAVPTVVDCGVPAVAAIDAGVATAGSMSEVERGKSW